MTCPKDRIFIREKPALDGEDGYTYLVLEDWVGRKVWYSRGYPRGLMFWMLFYRLALNGVQLHPSSLMNEGSFARPRNEVWESVMNELETHRA